MSPQHLITAAPSNRWPSRSPKDETLRLVFRSPAEREDPPRSLRLWVWILFWMSMLTLSTAFLSTSAEEMVLKSARCRGLMRFSGSILPWKSGDNPAFFNIWTAIGRGNAVSTVILLPSLMASSISAAAPGLWEYNEFVEEIEERDVEMKVRGTVGYIRYFGRKVF